MLCYTYFGAQGGSRTHTSKTADFESAAAAITPLKHRSTTFDVNRLLLTSGFTAIPIRRFASPGFCYQLIPYW